MSFVTLIAEQSSTTASVLMHASLPQCRALFFVPASTSAGAHPLRAAAMILVTRQLSPPGSHLATGRKCAALAKLFVSISIEFEPFLAFICGLSLAAFERAERNIAVDANTIAAAGRRNVFKIGT